MGKRGTDLEQFLMQYPYLLRWVNECLSCHHKDTNLKCQNLTLIIPYSFLRSYAAS